MVVFRTVSTPTNSVSENIKDTMTGNLNRYVLLLVVNM
jgi:hypothetical protein